MPSIDVLDTTPREQYYAAGGQTVFIYPFLIYSSADLVVKNGTTTLSEGADYTVTGVLNENGGTVVLTSGAALNDIITIYRVSSRGRTSQYQPGGKFGAESLERDLDRVFTILQEDERDLSRTIRLSPEDELSEFTLPADRANKFLAFNSLKVPIASEGPTSVGTPFGTVGIDLAAAETASDARTIIGLPSNASLKSVYSLGSLVDLSEVSNSTLSDMAANTVKVRAASTSGDPSDLALSASTFLGRGSTGDVTACSFGPGLRMIGTTLGYTGWQLLSTKTASASADLQFTSLITSTYDTYAFELQDIIPSVDAADFRMRTSTNNGSSWDSGATDYRQGGVSNHDGTATVSALNGVQGHIFLAVDVGNASGESLSGTIKLFNPLGSASYRMGRAEMSYLSAVPNMNHYNLSFSRATNADIDAVIFYFDSGNITSGIIRMYGLMK